MEDYVPSMSRTSSIAEQLAAIAEKQQAAFKELTAALGAGNVARRDRAQARIATLTADYHRLTEALRFSELEPRAVGDAPRMRKPSKPLREQVLDALEDLGVPAAPGLIADLTAALTGDRPSPSRFASLRRDEESSCRRNIAARPAWVVPALNADQLTAIPRLLSSSAWPMERRVLGARSLRTDNLRIAQRLAQRLAGLREAGATQAQSVERLLYPIARSIPGAVERAGSLDTDRVRDMAGAELALLEDADLDERRKAAQRLKDASPMHRLWGRPMLLDTSHSERALR
jgi:hypothetical protein